LQTLETPVRADKAKHQTNPPRRDFFVSVLFKYLYQLMQFHIHFEPFTKFLEHFLLIIIFTLFL